MKLVRGVLCAALAAVPTLAAAEYSNGEVRIAVLTDMRGVYSKVAGQGAAIAAEMAIEDFGGKVDGKKIRLFVEDHQSDGQIALRLGQKLHKEHNVDAFVEMVSSGTALPLQRYSRENNIVALHSGPASPALTSEECSPTGVHWTYDTYSLAVGTGRAVVDQGGKSWYFITADYAFGHSLEADTAQVVKTQGGKVLGSTRHPFKGTDFTPYLLEAQASGAQIIGLANAGGDTINAVRQAYEFGLTQGDQRLAGLLVFISEVRQLGLYVAGGLQLTTGFYWDLDDQTRAWSKRFYERSGAMPTMVQAGVYSSLMHYFKAMEAAGTDEGKAVVAKMRELPINDFFARNGKLRRDGRMVHDMYLVEVKKPSEAKGAWDYYKVLKVIPGDEAFRPMSEGKCPFAK